MTRQRLSLLPLVAALAFSCCASSSGRLRSRSTDGPGDAVALEVVHRFTLDHDGTRRHRLHERTRLLTEFGVDELGDPRLVHRAGPGSLQVLRAETTMRDGKVVAIRPNSITETTPDALGLAPDYADLRETVVTLVGLETGCTTRLEHEVVDRGGAMPLWAEVPLATWYPTEALRVEVEVPEDFPLRWSCLGCSAQPVERKGAGGATLQFAFTRVAPLNLHEVEHTHGPAAGQPRLVFSTAASWRDLVDTLRADFDRAAAVDETIRARAAALTAHALLPLERALALQRFVARDLRGVSWPQDLLGWTPRPAARTLETSYGHALDRAVLLRALLAAAGLEATPVLVSRDALLDPRVPMLAPFAEVWLVVELDGQPLWLSPSQVHGAHGLARLEGRWVLPLLAGRPGRLPVLIAKSPLALGQPTRVALADDAASQHQSQLTATLTLAADRGLVVDVDQRLTGAYGAWHEVDPEKGGQALASGLVAALGLPEGLVVREGQAARLVELGPAQTRVVASLHGTAPGAGGVIEVPLPRPARGQIGDLDLHRLRRDFPVELAHRGVERSVITVALPEGVELRSKLLEGQVQNRVGRVTTSHRREGGRLVLTRELEIRQRVVPPEQWPELRDLALEVLRADGQSLLLVQKVES